MSSSSAEKRRIAPLKTPSGLPSNAITDISAALTTLLADMFALYLKTKNFHWHVSGPHFRDYHLLLDEQAEQIFSTTDDIAERARKIGGTTLRSIGHAARLQRIPDNDADYVTPGDMLAELLEDDPPGDGEAWRDPASLPPPREPPPPPPDSRGTARSWATASTGVRASASRILPARALIVASIRPLRRATCVPDGDVPQSPPSR